MSSVFLKQYKYAWENHCTKTVKKLFHEDIIYQEHCDHIITGLSELIEYWEENSEKQRDVFFKYSNVIQEKDTLALHWTASFYDTKKEVNVNLEGLMWLVIKGSKIVKLIEFFEKNDYASRG